MSEEILSIDNMSVMIGERAILEGLTFSVRAGEICALLGQNGAGKTVTLKTIMGLQPFAEGTIQIGGLDVTVDYEDYKRQFAYIPEEAMLFQELTVRQHFQFYGLSYGVPEELYEQRVAELVAKFALVDRLDERPSELSKGMRQKVNIISCLLVDTPLLIVDEPFIGLDRQAAAHLEQELRAQAERGRAILLTSHVLERVRQLCDSYVLLQNGAVASRGPIAALREEEVVRP